MEALNKEATYGLADEMDKHCRYGGNARGGEVRGQRDGYHKRQRCWRDRQGAGKAVRQQRAAQRQNHDGGAALVLLRLKQAYAGHRQQQNAGERPRGKYEQRYCKDEQQRRRDSSANSLITVHTDKAVAFMNPMTHVEAYRPEKGFSDAVKGFVLHQAKIVRPRSLWCWNCKAGA